MKLPPERQKCKLVFRVSCRCLHALTPAQISLLCIKRLQMNTTGGDILYKVLHPCKRSIIITVTTVSAFLSAVAKVKLDPLTSSRIMSLSFPPAAREFNAVAAPGESCLYALLSACGQVFHTCFSLYLIKCPLMQMCDNKPPTRT